MRALDFEYDGQYLSDFGFIICDLYDSGGGVKTMSAGSNITFETVPMHWGKKWSLLNTKYDECIHVIFSIGKNPSIYGRNKMEITNDEYRNLIRWLNRREFLKFRFIGDEKYDGETCYYMGSFNISQIYIDGILYGLELSMVTNAPFGYGQEQSFAWTVNDTSKPYIIYDMQDEIGYSGVEMNIEIKSDGDLSIYNDFTKNNTIIKNCKAGEIITMDSRYGIIKSSLNEHKLCKDFNFDFLYIGNGYYSRKNEITCSLPCNIKLKYTPIIKGLMI